MTITAKPVNGATGWGTTLNAHLDSLKEYIDDQITAIVSGTGFWKTSGETVYNAQPAVNDTWYDVDLSSIVGETEALCYFEVTWPSGGANNWFKMKNPSYGSATPSQHNVGSASAFSGTGGYHGMVVCSTNSSGIVQIAISDRANSGVVTIKLIGYVA